MVIGYLLLVTRDWSYVISSCFGGSCFYELKTLVYVSKDFHGFRGI